MESDQKILVEKIYTIKEISAWMGLKNPTSFTNNREKKLEELKFFCDYEITNTKKIKVTKIKEPIYIKNGSKNYSIVKEEFPHQWNADGIDQCSNVSIKVQDARKDLTIKEGSTYKYVLKAKKEYVFDGYYKEDCVLVKKIGRNGKAIFEGFTDEEMKIVNHYFSIYFPGSAVDEIVILDMWHSGEIDAEELAQRMSILKGYTYNTWLECLNAIHDALKLGNNVIIQRATKLTENAIKW